MHPGYVISTLETNFPRVFISKFTHNNHAILWHTEVVIIMERSYVLYYSTEVESIQLTTQ